MSAICYYSNFCEPCKKLLQLIARTKLNQEIHFICIDTRMKDAKGQTVLIVQNQKLLLPPSVVRVPALLILESNKVLFEDDIYKYLKPKEDTLTHVATAGQMEPESYSSQMMSSMSDSYSFWDQEASDLTTKGDGGMRQMHNYVTVDQSFTIPTPPETYEPDKIGKGGSKSLEEYKKERENSIVAPIQRI